MFLLIVFLMYARSITSYATVLRMSDGKIITMDEAIEELRGTDIVFIGENHDNEKHHRFQLEIIRAMVDAGIRLSVGFEMFQAKDQEDLNGWIDGDMEVEQFRLVYSRSWNLPWPLYDDIFLFLKKKSIPMVGLNISKSIGSKISSHGFESLDQDDLKELPPDVTCDDINDRYREYIQMAYDHHSWKNGGFEYFCEAQMIWDKSMAWHLLEHMRKNTGLTAVVIAGMGHAWKPGIPEQVRKAAGYSFKVILPEITDQMNEKRITIEEADYILLR